MNTMYNYTQKGLWSKSGGATSGVVAVVRASTKKDFRFSGA